MPRWTARPLSDRALELANATKTCPACGGPAWAAAKPQRSVTTLDGVVRLHLQLRSCRNPDCPRRGACLRPEQEGRFALPHHEFGLDVIATDRHPPPRPAPQHPRDPRRAESPRRRRSPSGPSPTSWTATTSCSPYPAPTSRRLRRVTAQAGRVILAIDGLQPDVGHEVLWVIRDVLSGEVLLARSLLSSTQDDLARLLGEVKDALNVPIAGVVSDGQSSIRKAVAEALKGVPHQLCHFHYLREAATPVYEADRHAKVQLKKKVRGIRPIERKRPAEYVWKAF